MPEKLILENRTDLPIDQAMQMFFSVVKEGKISESAGKLQYCFYTTFKNGYGVAAFRNKNSDRLVLVQDNSCTHIKHDIL